MALRSGLLAFVILLAAPALAADDAALEAELRALRAKVSELETSRDSALEQMQELRRVVDDMQRQLQGAGVAEPPGASSVPPPVASERPAEAPPRVARNETAAGSEPGEIGEDKAEARRRFQAERAILEREGAVLVPGGQLVLEPGFQYTNSARNVLNLSGVQFLGAILIGRVDVAAIDRETFTTTLEARYGLHDRVELEATVPYSYRTDRFLTDLGGPAEDVSYANSNGFGDVQFGVFTQLLYQEKWWPSVVLNLQAKAPTGEDPFEVDEDELPLGLGTWAASAGLSMVRALDPAVLYSSARYIVDIEDEFDGVGDIDYGDTFEYTAGMAFALNERLALSLSLTHSITDRTEVNGTTIEGSDLNVARLFLGGSYRINNFLTANLSLGVGLTEDAPDYTIELSFPLRFPKRLPHL